MSIPPFRKFPTPPQPMTVADHKAMIDRINAKPDPTSEFEPMLNALMVYIYASESIQNS